MSNKGNSISQILSQAILTLAVMFSVYMAWHAWIASNETGAGAAQGDLGFYLSLRMITPILLVITGIPFAWALYSGRNNIKVAMLSSVSILFYVNTLIILWCWYYVFNLWY